MSIITEFNKVVLENNFVRVEFDRKGRIYKVNLNDEDIVTDNYDTYSLRIGYSEEKDKWNARSWEELDAEYQTVKLVETDEVVLEAENVRNTGVNIRTHITLSESKLNFEVKVENKGNGTLVSVTPFCIKGIKSSEKSILYIPLSAGHKINGAFRTLSCKGHAKMSNIYPVPMSMQMITHTEDSSTISISCEDEFMAYKVFDIYSQENGMELTLYPFLESAQSTELPDINVYLYKGDWHYASDKYGEWFRSFALNKKEGTYLQDMPILNELFIKGRPGEPEMGCGTFDAAIKEIDEHICYESSALSLVGWQGEGHDDDYPDYKVGTKQGGPEKLKKVIEHLHNLKMLSGLYTNGRLVDKASFFFNNNPDCLIRTCEKPLYIVTETWGNIVFGIVNPGNEVYIENYLKLTERLFGEYKIDYMQMDQVGAAPGFILYNRDSGFSDPAKAWSEGNFKMLNAVYNVVIHFNKQGFTFIEGAWDGATQYCGLLQGGNFVGDKFGSEYFPEFFSYTMYDRWIRGDIMTGTSPLWIGTLKDASVRLMRVCKDYIINARFMDTVGLEYNSDEIKVTWRDSKKGILVAVHKKEFDGSYFAEFILNNEKFYSSASYSVCDAENMNSICDFKIMDGKIFVKIEMYCDTVAVIIKEENFAES